MILLFAGFLLLQTQTFTFLGLDIPVNPDHLEWAQSTNKINFSEIQFEEIASELVLDTIVTAGFTDWQKIQFSIAYSGELFPTNKEKSSQLTYYLWRKWGFETERVKTDSGLIVPLISVSQQLFGLQFYRISGKKFFDVLKLTQSEKDNGKIKITLEDKDPDEGTDFRPVTFNIGELPVTGVAKTEKILTWTFKEQTYSTKVELNRNLSLYYFSLPNIRFQDALTYRFSPDLLRTLVIPLKAQMKENGLTEHEKVECIRQLLLQCFPYIDDQVLFGYEHLQFPEEILLSEGCDCEDRSVFMFKLVEELTSLKPLLADFPEHVSLLVTAPEGWEGEVYEFGSRYYVYCDPTYFNAPFGETPEEIRELIPEIIDYDEK